MSCKAYFEDFYENVSETLIGDQEGKCNDCLWGLVFNFEEELTSFKFKHLIKFSSLLMWIMFPKVFYQLI